VPPPKVPFWRSSVEEGCVIRIPPLLIGSRTKFFLPIRSRLQRSSQVRNERGAFCWRLLILESLIYDSNMIEYQQQKGVSRFQAGKRCDMIRSASGQINIAYALSKLDPIDRTQVEIWRKMTPARRLEIAFQAYQFVLDAVRVTEHKKYPDLSPEELAWRVTRRIQGNLKLGRSSDGSSSR
jgi:hypothetical protein